MSFQLTASRRGWQKWTDVPELWNKFQLTASRRGWRKCRVKSDSFRAISTHSLTKRLTMYSAKRVSPITAFQLTASRRGWRVKKITKLSTILFQLTASRRGWLWLLSIASGCCHFNSQPHEEADYNVNYLCHNRKHFNSQPHEEADDNVVIRAPDSYISTHSLTKRLTRPVWKASADCRHFNSQPHEEADNVLRNC